MGNYLAQADLEAEFSAGLIARLLDDDNDGVADAASVARLIAGAESTFEGYVRGNYGTLAAMRAAAPERAKTLCLDLARVRLATRWPDQFPGLGEPSALIEYRRQVLSELRDLRDAKTRLDVDGAPEPPANVGGVVLSSDPDDTTPPARFFGEGATGTGDY